jgi:hypothetical protein
VVALLFRSARVVPNEGKVTVAHHPMVRAIGASDPIVRLAINGRGGAEHIICLSPDEVGQALFDVGHGLSNHEQATAHVLPLSLKIPDGQDFDWAKIGGFAEFLAACEAEQISATCSFPRPSRRPL